jgi:hypothetical protein
LCLGGEPQCSDPTTEAQRPYCLPDLTHLIQRRAAKLSTQQGSRELPVELLTNQIKTAFYLSMQTNGGQNFAQ